jgi:hypothetical protein
MNALKADLQKFLLVKATYKVSRVNTYLNISILGDELNASLKAS